MCLRGEDVQSSCDINTNAHECQIDCIQKRVQSITAEVDTLVAVANTIRAGLTERAPERMRFGLTSLSNAVFARVKGSK